MSQENLYTVVVTVRAYNSEEALQNVIEHLSAGGSPDEVRKLISVDGRTYENVTREVVGG